MNARKWAAWAVLAAGLWLVGCQANSTIDTGSGAPREVSTPSEPVAKSRPPVPDLPVPVGFDMDTGRSRSYAAGGFRLVDHSYTGRADKWAVGRFYKRQMPINRWTLESDRMIRGSLFLDFTKDGERCTITIEDNGYSLFKPTLVRVDIHPSGKVEAPVDR